MEEHYVTEEGVAGRKQETVNIQTDKLTHNMHYASSSFRLETKIITESHNLLPHLSHQQYDSKVS